MLSTTPASGRSDGAQCSWKLDSSTASTSAAARASTSSTGSPMFPHSTARRPAAVSIACSIDVVVVLPLVPVTTSQRRGGPYRPDWSSRQANSTSPQTGTSRPRAAAASTGAVGGKPGLVTTRPNRRSARRPAAGVGHRPVRASTDVSADALSSASVARTPSGAGPRAPRGR